MNKITKTILIGGALSASIGLGTMAVMSLDDASPKVEERTPSQIEVQLQIDPTDDIPAEMRIVPTPRLEFFPEESFTLNDIFSEIEIEYSRNGESERYFQLVDLRDMVNAELPIGRPDPTSSPQLENENI